MQTLTLTLSLALCLVSSTPLNSQTPTHPSEETTFSESDAIARPVAVPPAVADLILADLAEKNVGYGPPQRGKDPDQLFAGSEIHLGPANELHLIVVGVCPPMCGADSAWLWIIRSPYKSPKIIGGASGGSFAFLRTRSEGYRDLESYWSSACNWWEKDVYRFRGSEYKHWRHSEGKFAEPCQ
jgi:hypothetical protein